MECEFFSFFSNTAHPKFFLESFPIIILVLCKKTEVQISTTEHARWPTDASFQISYSSIGRDYTKNVNKLTHLLGVVFRPR